MAERIVRYSLYLLHVRTLPQQRKSVDWLAGLLVLIVLCGLATLAENVPVPGYGLMYVLVAAIPFLFGINWHSDMLTAQDREGVTMRFGPVRAGLDMIVLAIILGGMKALAGEVKSFVQYLTWAGWGTLALGVLLVAAVYIPFLAGRAISIRSRRGMA